MRSMGTRNRRFSQRRPSRPSRSWVSLDTGFSFTAITVTSASSLISLQAPTSLALTSDPPEDLTVLRIKGDFETLIAANTGRWVLALLMQDTTWTPSSTFAPDADKRILWSQTYESGAATSLLVYPGWMNVGGTIIEAPREMWHIDVAPKVKLEAGKALYLAAYEEAGSSGLTVAGLSVRMLFQRTGKR